MELKVVCPCGQKYKFDVEPVGGRMPFTINCPVCNTDGTTAANALIAGQPGIALSAMASPPPIAPVSGGLKINRSVPEADTAVAITPAALVSSGSTPPPISGMRPGMTDKKSKPGVEGEFSLVRGILGAVLGTGVGCGLMFAFWLWAHFRFPLMGIAVGAAAGYGARWLGRGTETTMGIITAVIAGASVTGTFVLMYGDFAFFNIISIVICAGVAYRLSSE
jgi:hypothetical protein